MKLKKSKQFRYIIVSEDNVDNVYGDMNELMDLVKQIEILMKKEITFNNIDNVNFDN
jgi:hypothetical protein